MSVPLFDTNDLMDRIEDHLVRIEADTALLHPQGEIIIGKSNDGNTSKQLKQFFMREQARRVARMLDRADDRLARAATTLGGARNARLTGRGSSRRGVSGAPKKSKRQLAKLDPTLVAFDDNLLGQNLYRLLQDYALQSIPYGDHIGDYLQDLLREAALLDAVAGSGDVPAEKTWLTIASLDERGRAACIRLRDLYRTLFEREFGCITSLPGARIKEGVKSQGHFESLSIDGPLASVLGPLEAGTHLFVSSDESYTPIVVRSSQSIEHELDGMPPVVRIYSDPGATLDIRSRLLARGALGRAELRAFILSALPVPNELEK
jgi:hypothetical protein